MAEETVAIRRPEEVLGDMDQRLGEEEGASCAIPLAKDIKEGPHEPLGLLLVIVVGLAGKLSMRADGRDVSKMPRHLPVEVQVGEDGLSPPGHGLLGELEDEHLGQLLYLGITHPHEVGSEEEVDRI